MFNRATARHEAGHAVACAALGVRHVAFVRSDGSGEVSSRGDTLIGDLHPEDRAVILLAGRVGEAMALGGTLPKAVKDTLALEHDGALLREALSEIPSWRYPHGAAVEMAARARGILVNNRAEFDRLTHELMEHGIGHVKDMGPVPAAAAAAASQAAARSLANGKQAGPVELRSMLSDAKAAGHTVLAKLLEASIAGREGRDVEQFMERRVMGQLLVERELATDGR